MNTVRKTVDQVRIGPGMLAFLVTLILAFIGGVWSLAMAINEVNARLDRNLAEINRLQDRTANGQNGICIAIKQLDNDLRLHEIATGNPKRGLGLEVDC